VKKLINAISLDIGPKVLMICFFFCTLFSLPPTFAQSGPALIEDMLLTPGVPSGLTGVETYRCKSYSFFTLPDTLSIQYLNDFEKAYLQEFRKDERFLQAYDSAGAGTMVKRVLNPNRQFVPQALPYQSMIIYEDTVLFFTATGDLIHKVDIGAVIAGDTIQFDTTPPTPEDLLLLRGFESPQFIKENQDGRHYELDQYQIVVNQSSGVISVTLLDEHDEWMIKRLEFFDTLDIYRSVPLFEINMTRDSLYSGKCIFHVLMETYSEYYREDSIFSVQMLVTSEFDIQPAENNIKIWPNPASFNAEIFIPEFAGTESVQVSIYSIDGKRVYFENLATGINHNIVVTGWTAGLYIVRCDAPGISLIEKLIIK
jgi:hypothetical protein